MPRIHLETRISAPVERCFDLMRSVDAHVRSFEYSSPLGPLGILADRLFLERYMRRFLRGRADFVKQRAEQEA